MSETRCPSCGGYSSDALGRCKCCGLVSPATGPKPRFELGKVDPFRLAQLLKEKRDKEEQEKQKP